MSDPKLTDPEGPSPWDAIASALRQEDVDLVQRLVTELDPAQAPRVLARLDSTEHAGLLEALPPEAAARLLQHLPDVQIAEVIADADPASAAHILDLLRSNAQADVLTELSPEAASAVLELMAPEEAADVERLIAYEEHVAGGIMISEYLAFPESITIGGVLDDLRGNTDRYRRHEVQYIYVTDDGGRLRGVLRLRDLVLTPPDTAVREIMITGTSSVPVDAPLEDLREFFSTRPYRGVPVVDADEHLVGVVRHADVAEAREEQAASDLLKAQGIVGGEELRTMPVFTRSWRRLSWLSINIVLNIVAASVIAAYQETLAAVIVLAVFLPIISDMSGCSGNQAIAVSMRELTLGIVRPADALRVWGKELSVGLINALALGTLLGVAAFLWKGSLVLSLVVGLALALNTMVAVSLGGLVPLVLRGLKLDPALASGPILTTVTDMCGFFLVLSLATAVLPSLT